MFLEQARWLLEWHNRRSDGFATKAVALLGFTGVTLALLLQGVRLPNVQATCGIWAALIALVVLLILTAFFCLLALGPKKAQMPDIAQLRDRRKGYAAKPIQGYYRAQITETFLSATDTNRPSPVDSARDEANLRGRRFRWATWSMLGALLALSALVIQVLSQATGG